MTSVKENVPKVSSNCVCVGSVCDRGATNYGNNVEIRRWTMDCQVSHVWTALRWDVRYEWYIRIALKSCSLKSCVLSWTNIVPVYPRDGSSSTLSVRSFTDVPTNVIRLPLTIETDVYLFALMFNPSCIHCHGILYWHTCCFQCRCMCNIVLLSKLC